MLFRSKRCKLNNDGILYCSNLIQFLDFFKGSYKGCDMRAIKAVIKVFKSHNNETVWQLTNKFALEQMGMDKSAKLLTVRKIVQSFLTMITNLQSMQAVLGASVPSASNDAEMEDASGDKVAMVAAAETNIESSNKDLIPAAQMEFNNSMVNKMKKYYNELDHLRCSFKKFRDETYAKNNGTIAKSIKMVASAAAAASAGDENLLSNSSQDKERPKLPPGDFM